MTKLFGTALIGQGIKSLGIADVSPGDHETTVGFGYFYLHSTFCLPDENLLATLLPLTECPLCL